MCVVLFRAACDRRGVFVRMGRPGRGHHSVRARRATQRSTLTACVVAGALQQAYAHLQAQRRQRGAAGEDEPSEGSPDFIDVNDVDSYRRTPLHLGAAGNHGAVVKCLLLNGADPDAVDEFGTTPLVAAKGAGATAALQELQDANVLFWNASVRANRLYNEKHFDLAVAAYSEALRLALEEGLVRCVRRQLVLVVVAVLPCCSSRTCSHMCVWIVSRLCDVRATQGTSHRDVATLYYNRARASYRMGLHCSAINDCCLALEKDASYRNAIAQRAECYMVRAAGSHVRALLPRRNATCRARVPRPPCQRRVSALRSLCSILSARCVTSKRCWRATRRTGSGTAGCTTRGRCGTSRTTTCWACRKTPTPRR